MWLKQHQLDPGERDDGLTTEERDELPQLRREVRELEQEREIQRRGQRRRRPQRRNPAATESPPVPGPISGLLAHQLRSGLT